MARERAADQWAERHQEQAPEGFRRVRVYDMKRTFGRRLRAANVNFEDRQDLLGHRSGRITTHYSQAELTNLIEAADNVCIGVKEVAEQIWMISFMHYDLGFFDHQSNRVECAPNPFDAKVLPMSSV